MAGNRDGFLIILCALLLESALIGTCEGKLPIPFTKHRVQVENEMRSESLNVHCFYLDDDLGEHVVPPGGMYQWSFRIDIWIATKYYCELRWPGWGESFVAYDARDPRFYSFCGGGTCRWRATEDEISLFNADQGHWYLMYWWKPF